MSRSDAPSWYQPGDVEQTVREACRDFERSREIVEVLHEHEFDAPRARIQRLVETTRSRLPESESQSPSDDDREDPRTHVARFVDVPDSGYLSRPEFALILGAVLSRYGGSFRTPDDIDELAVDLFWNRQHTTIAFTTLIRPAGGPVEDNDVNTVIEGKTTPPTGRSPSIIGIVSNAGFTTDARERASEHDIELFEEGHLSRWFTDAQLTHDTLGAILEEGEKSPAEIDEILSNLQSFPDSVREDDPLESVHQKAWTSSDVGEPPPTSITQPMPVADERPTPGQQGELYADPSEDGDFSAFDRFANELTEDD